MLREYGETTGIGGQTVIYSGHHHQSLCSRAIHNCHMLDKRLKNYDKYNNAEDQSPCPTDPRAKLVWSTLDLEIANSWNTVLQHKKLGLGMQIWGMWGSDDLG